MADAAPRRILIIKPSSLGDIVHALPVLAAARRTHPTAHIAWLVAKDFAPLLAGNPLLDELLIFDRNRWSSMWRSPAALSEFIQFCRILRRREFDLVLDLQGLFRSAFFTWRTAAPRRLGFANARELGWMSYTQHVTPDPNVVHAVSKNLALAAAAGLNVKPIEFPLAVTPQEAQAAEKMLSDAGVDPTAFAAVILGARWESKRWADQKFAQLIPLLQQSGLKCVLLGGRAESPSAANVIARAGAPVASLVGATSLRELAAILSFSRLVIALDSGPLHLATALQRPTIGIFGPTDPRRTGPFSELARVVTHPVPCAPCLQRTCPLKHQNCLQMLEPATVAEQAAQLLNSTVVTTH